MKHRSKKDISAGVFLFITAAFCLLLAVSMVFLLLFHGGNDTSSFSEPVLTMSDGWTLTDSEGFSRLTNLPETISYGADGRFTLSHTLPDTGGSLSSPAFRFYSNYVDISVALDGVELYSFPNTEAEFSGATGNTYHFVRLPTDYIGRTITVSIRCQLGDDITYLLNPALLGSKATMLEKDVMRSMPSFTLAGCMAILAIGLGALYFMLNKQVAQSRATLYTAVFSLLFAVYVYFETSFAQILMPNGYMLCYSTLTLLALIPIPVLGIFLDAVGARFKKLLYAVMALCALNTTVQTILNFTGVMSVRAMIPATHAVIILSIAVVSLSLFFSDKSEKPDARRSLLSAVPMVVGGVSDIALLNLNRPSPNNSFWFSLGVTAFIAIQIGGFVYNYFRLYRASLESQLLSDMAYNDTLSGIGNRNAYERRLKELSMTEPQEELCCIVADINDLKLINDRLGHQAGDLAIAEVGKLLKECMPERASYFRTGGDEFVILLSGCGERGVSALADKLYEEARRLGRLRDIPISLAIGCGQYSRADGNIIDFIRRVDTLMYECKRRQKCENRIWIDG